MAQRVAVGPNHRRGIRLMGPDGKAKTYRRGELLPEGTEMPPRYFRDKRVVRVTEETVKKILPKPKPSLKTEKQVVQSAAPSPSSEAAGVNLAPAPLEVNGAPNEKKKRRRKKLFTKD